MHFKAGQLSLRRWISVRAALVIAMTIPAGCGELRSARSVDRDRCAAADTRHVALSLLMGDDIGFGDPFEFIAAAEPGREGTGNFDVGDYPAAGGAETMDVITTIPADDPADPGVMQLFLNQGVVEGEWLGLIPNKPEPIGREPSGVAVGLFNNDDFLDAVVSNAGDDNLSLLINSGMGDGTFLPAVPIAVGARPSDVIAAHYNVDNYLDLAIPNEDDNTLTVLFNDGNGNFTEAAAAFDTGGLRPTAVDPEDLDNDKCVDVIGVNEVRLGGAFPGGEDVGSVFILFNNNGLFEPAMTFDVGFRPTDVVAADFDGDGYSDVAVSNTDSGTVSVLLNLGDGTLGPPIDFPVGLQPRAIDAVDLDGDNDPDLAIVADSRKQGRVVQVLRNVTARPGALAFDTPVSFSVDADPKVVVSSDMNLDAMDDLITVNADPDGETGGSVSVLLNNSPALCPWDLDDSGAVGPEDLIALLGAWGVVDDPADFEDPPGVGPEDLIVLLGNWGECP